MTRESRTKHRQRQHGRRRTGSERTAADERRERERDQMAIPELPIRTMTVRAVGDAVVYTAEGAQIPNDAWVTVPLSASLVQSVKYGDLEEAEESEPKEAA